MEEKILNWLWDFIIPLDIKDDKEIESVFIDSLTTEYLQIGILKVDNTVEDYRVKVERVNE